MKNKLKIITIDLLLANNLKKIIKNKNDIIDFFDQMNDKVLSTTMKPIIENEYQKIIEMLDINFDSNIEQERLKVVCFLTSLNLILD